MAGGVELRDEGGRVTELCARPLLRAFYPELAGLSQPLAGEVAARRALLERIPFATGYGVELAMLLDVYTETGLDAIAEVDVGERRNNHQPLSAVVSATRALCLGGPTAGHVVAALAWCAGILVVAVPLAVGRYRRTL